MAGDDEQALELNDLERFTKHSTRLLLEEYSHCEVPAGCGGVVLRWVDPATQGVTVRMWFYTAAARSELWLDGAPASASRMTLAAGRHVLAVALEEVPNSPGCLLFVASNRREVLSGVRRAGRSVPEVDVASGQVGRWRFTLQVPGDGWTALDHDDSAWHPMVPGEVPAPPAGEAGAWQHRSLTGAGAQGLGIGGAAARVWIRGVFDIDLTVPGDAEVTT